jgi:hypothetical protein
MTQDGSVDLVLRLEAAFDQPVEKVWPYLFRWNLWVDPKDFVSHRIAGNADNEGEVMAVNHFDETGRLDSLFFVKLLKAVPNSQLVYKILSPQHTYDAETGRQQEVPQTGYEVFSIFERHGRTVIMLDLLMEIGITGLTADQVQEVGTRFREETEKKWYQEYFPKLESLSSKP